MSDWTSMLVDLPFVPAVLVKVTVLLAIAWVAHAALRWRNPRWRVLLWRCVLAAVVALPLADRGLPRLEIPILRESANAEVSTTFPVEFDPIPYEPISVIETPVGDYQPRPALPPPPFDLRAWGTEHVALLLAITWCLIALALLTAVARGWLRVRRIIAHSLPAPTAIRTLADHVAREFGLEAEIEVEGASRPFNAAGRRVYLDVRVMENLGSPFLTGILRPIIVLPLRCVDKPDASRLRAILAHELAHVKSRDPFWLACGRLITSLLWFHPLMWRVTSAHSAACEEVCDGVAANYLGSAETYSQALAQEALALHTAQPAPGGVPMLRTAEIVHRLRRIQRGIRSIPLARRWVTISATTTTAMLAILGGIRFVNAEPQPQRARNQEETTSERLLETIRSSTTTKENLINSFRCQFSTRVEQGRYRGPAVTYFDYIVSGPQFRLLEKEVYPDDSIKTKECYWDGSTLTTYNSSYPTADRTHAMPRGVVFTPLDAAGLYIGGTSWGKSLRDLISQMPPPKVSREIDDFVEYIVLNTHDGRQRVWLNPARDLLPMKWEWFYSDEAAPGAGAVAEYTTIIDDIKEVSPGILLPIKWTRIRGVGPPVPKDAWGLPESVERYEVSLIEVNQDYPVEFFSADLRERTTAIDATSGDWTTSPTASSEPLVNVGSADLGAQEKAPAPPQALAVQPDRLPLGLVRVGARVDASVLVTREGNEVAETEVRVTPPPFVVIKDKRIDTDQDSEGGPHVRCAIYMSIDTSKTGDFNAPLRVEMDGAQVEIPVQITVLGDTSPATRVLIAETPFHTTSTKDPTLFEPWLQIVQAANLDVNYIDYVHRGPVVHDLQLDAFDVILLAQASLVFLTDEDVGKLRTFLDHGGRLILAADSFFRGTVPSANRLLTQYGLEMADEEMPSRQANVPYYTAEVAGAQLPDSRFTRGITRLGFFRPSPVRILDEAQATILAPDPDNPDQGFVAIANAGAGEVIALGQSLWWDWIAGTHMQPNNGPYDNAEFFALLITQPAGEIIR